MKPNNLATDQTRQEDTGKKIWGKKIRESVISFLCFCPRFFCPCLFAGGTGGDGDCAFDGGGTGDADGDGEPGEIFEERVMDTAFLQNRSLAWG